MALSTRVGEAWAHALSAPSVGHRLHTREEISMLPLTSSQASKLAKTREEMLPLRLTINIESSLVDLKTHMWDSIDSSYSFSDWDSILTHSVGDQSPIYDHFFWQLFQSNSFILTFIFMYAWWVISIIITITIPFHSIPDYQNRNVDVVNQLMCNKFSDWCSAPPWQEVGFSHICESGNETFKKSDSNCFYHKWQNVTSMGLQRRTNICDSLMIFNKEGDICWTRKWKMSKDMVIANERYWHYTDLSVT